MAFGQVLARLAALQIRRVQATRDLAARPQANARWGATRPGNHAPSSRHAAHVSGRRPGATPAACRLPGGVMNASTVVSLLLIGAAAVWVLARQVQPARVKPRLL